MKGEHTVISTVVMDMYDGAIIDVLLTAECDESKVVSIRAVMSGELSTCQITAVEQFCDEEVLLMHGFQSCLAELKERGVTDIRRAEDASIPEIVIPML